MVRTMKVVDLQLYRNKRTLETIGKKMASLALLPHQDTARQMKSCFKQWIEVSKKEVC